ncbi:MAG: methyltransferase [Theionarchaea archaeon]|nr:methyltransferase [Theionarchaea archaeon]MBU7037364.1 methyltransferase [Theionarchaea archaeon]
MFTITTDPEVYGPREDTFLLLDALVDEELSGRALEIGVGTGVITLNLAHRFQEMVGVDIDPRAVALAEYNAEENGVTNVQFHCSDLFSSVSGAFDVIIFNPPYCPSDELSIQDFSCDGGPDGRNTIDAFLSQFNGFLSPEGRVYLLQSSLSNLAQTRTYLEARKFDCTILVRTRLFFEELVVFRIQHSKSEIQLSESKRRNCMTRREEIVQLLQDAEMTSLELAHHFKIPKKTVLSDLQHISRSLRNRNGDLTVKMPVCNHCGFTFKLTVIKEPSKCPNCNSEWIDPPTYRVVP